MEHHLDYDAADEDLTIAVKSEDDTVFCETTVCSVLLKMLSPWWKAKLTSTGFRDHVQESRCSFVHEAPRVAEFALNAARLRVKQPDLVAEGDLGFIFQIWQLADMWQFGYLSGLCQGALQELLTDTNAETLKSFVTAAPEHSETFLDTVLVPFFTDHPNERSQAIYLAFDDRAMFKLAEVAPIAGFQNGTMPFRERLQHYAESCEDSELVRYLKKNPEARSFSLYASQSFERCMLLFAAAPLPFVRSMVQLALDSSWSQEQKTLAMSAIDFCRVTSYDQKYLALHHEELPQQIYVYQALWKCTQKLVAFPAASMSASAPWAIVCCKDHYGTDEKIRAGPIELVMRSTRQGIFYCSKPAYGILGQSFDGRVVKPGVPFHFSTGSCLVVYVSPKAVILGS